MNDSVYYKATDEDGNIVLKHGWKNHKYLYIKNGKYVYPEDVKKAAKFVKKVVTRDVAAKKAVGKYLLDKASKSPTANAARAKVNSVKSKAEYKLTRAGDKLTNDIKSSGAYKSVKKEINSIPKNANKAYESVKNSIPTATEVRNKANSVKSKAEYKLTRAGEKLTNDVKSSGAYKSAKKGINSISKNANKAYKSAKKGINSISKNANKAYKSVKKEINSIPKNANKAYESVKNSIPTATEVRNKANSVKSKAEYKLTRAGEKLTNDVKSSGAYKSAKKGINSISKNANKAYKSANKELDRISKNANKAYKSAKKKAKKVNRTFNKAKQVGKAYLDYLTK